MAAPTDATGRGRALKLLLRAVVGVGVFGVLLARTDVGELAEQLSMAERIPIVAAIVLFFIGLAVSALRWREYLVALEYPLPYGTLYRLYFVGVFFNAFLPTGVGGDAYKALRIGRVRGQTARAFSSVFLDRFAGIVGLALIGLVLAVARLASGDRRWPAVLALLASLAILGAAGLLLGPGERLLGRGRLIPQTGIGGKIRQMMRGIHEAGRHPRAAAAGLALGIGFQGIVLGYHLLLGEALDVHVPVAAMASIIVLTAVVILAPITLSGLGLVEFVYIHGLGQYGVSNARAVAFALLVRAVMLLSSAAGGLVYLTMGGEVAPDPNRPTTPSPVNVDS